MTDQMLCPSIALPFVEFEKNSTGMIRAIDFEDCPATVQIAQNSLSETQLELWESWFGDNERQRLNQFRFACDRQLFVARRGLARLALPERIQVLPQNIAFYTSESGKLCWRADDVASEQDTWNSTSRSPDSV